MKTELRRQVLIPTSCLALLCFMLVSCVCLAALAIVKGPVAVGL